MGQWDFSMAEKCHHLAGVKDISLHFNAEKKSNTAHAALIRIRSFKTSGKLSTFISTQKFTITNKSFIKTHRIQDGTFYIWKSQEGKFKLTL